MSEQETYNGWTNRETWAVALHVNNDQGWQESVREALKADRDRMAEDGATLTEFEAGDIIRESVEGVLAPDMDGWSDRDYFRWVHATAGAQRDIGSLHRVNWTELGASFLEDLEDE